MKTRVLPLCGRNMALWLSALALAGSAAAGPLDGQGKRSGPDRPSTAETTAEREFRAGVQAQLSRDLDQAQAHFKLALNANPAFAPALLGLAGVAQARGDSSQAEAYLQRAERATPRAAEVHLGWGRYFLSQRQPARAEKAFIQARSLAPRTVDRPAELRNFLCLVYIATGRARRGELLSASVFVHHYALEHLLVLLRDLLPPDQCDGLDALDVWRRFETADPSLGAALGDAVSRPVEEAARALTDVADRELRVRWDGYPAAETQVVRDLLGW